MDGERSTRPERGPELRSVRCAARGFGYARATTEDRENEVPQPAHAAVVGIHLGNGARWPAEAPASIDDVAARLRKAGKSTAASHLLTAVDAAKAERKRQGRGYVLVGHILLKGGPGRLEQLNSQVSLVDEGWFVTLAEDLQRPIPLRLHGYEAVDIPLKGSPDQELLVLGDVSLSPVPAEKLGAAHGRVHGRGSEGPHPGLRLHLSRET